MLNSNCTNLQRLLTFYIIRVRVLNVVTGPKHYQVMNVAVAGATPCHVKPVHPI